MSRYDGMSRETMLDTVTGYTDDEATEKMADRTTAVDDFMKEKINIVWLKRDLRTQDHEPLQFADDANIPFIIIYILEPSMIKRADWSLRHSQFVFSSIENMNKHLKK